MGETNLAFVRVPGLCRITISHPHLGLGIAEEISQHRGATAIGDQMVDGGGRQQHPLPKDTGRGLAVG
jgi:hypothetical protein